ncbi:MAG: hypothetical protein AAF823_00095 [Planctomycetota bacterium]
MPSGLISQRSIAALPALAVVACVAIASLAHAQPNPKASARRLIGEAMQVEANGAHNLRLRALRHLRDPSLEPLFEALAIHAEPALRVHGILGLAELESPPTLDIARVAAIDNPLLQAELVSVALDAGMIPPAARDHLLDWADLAPGIRLLLYTRALDTDTPPRPADIAPLLEQPRLGRRGLAALLLAELDDPRGRDALLALDASTDPGRDAVRSMLLETAIRHDLTSARRWAHAIAAEAPDPSEPLAMLALRAALYLGEPRALRLWNDQFASAKPRPAQQVRLALVLTAIAPRLPADAFDALLQADDPLIARLGSTGRAIATGDPAVADELTRLAELRHTIALRWIVAFAERDHLAPPDAALALLGVVRAFERDPDRRLTDRHLDTAVEASRALVDTHPQAAADLLAPVLTHRATAVELRQAILLGLLRSQHPAASAVTRRTDPPRDTVARNLDLLLRARRHDPLAPDQLADLADLVSGAGDLAPSLRIQAAWLYLRHIGRADAALDRLLP